MNAALTQRRVDLNPCRSCLFIGLGLAAFSLFIAFYLLAQLALVQKSETWSTLVALFNSPQISQTLFFTLYQAGLSTALALVCGFTFAWALSAMGKFALRPAILALASVSFVLPSLVVVLGIVSVYGRAGWVNSLLEFFNLEALQFSPYGLSGILLAHVFFNGGIASRVFYSALTAIPLPRRKQSIALGLSPSSHFRFVILPAIKPVLPALVSTIFLLCFTSFAIVLTLGGSPKYNTLEVAIYEAVKFEFDLSRAFALAMLQLVVCIAVVFFLNRNRDKLISGAKPVDGNPLAFLSPPGARTAQRIVVVLGVLFFAGPIIAVIIDGVNPDFATVLYRQVFWNAFANSIAIATLSALMCVFIAASLTHAIVSLEMDSRAARLPFSKWLKFLLTLSGQIYLVVPALVFGLGLFIAFLQFGGNQNIWAFIGICLANTLFALPFAIAIFKPAFLRTAVAHDRLAASLGVGPWKRAMTIDLPLVKSDLYLAAGLAFCFSLGDLGVVALFASDEFRTLPWLLYQNFGSYRTGEAAAIALTMLIITVTVFFLATRTGKRVRHASP